MEYKVVIVDDHLVVREGLRLLIETNPKYIVVGDAEDGLKALEILDKLRPDVIIMDIYMPFLNGIETARKLSITHPSLPVVILTTYNEDKHLSDAFDLGVNGFLLKDTGPIELFKTLDTAVRGETFINEEMLKRIIKYKQPKEFSVKLTELEVMTVEAIARGLKNREIAKEFYVSERTIKARITNIFNKLGVNSRAEAVATVMHMDLIDFN